MKLLIFCLLVLFTLPNSCYSIECFVGPQDNTAVEKGYDYCVSTINVMTSELSYSGRTGNTTVFDKDPKNLIKNDCFVNLEDTKFCNCFCRGDKCNSKKTLSEFKFMMFDSRSN